MLEFANFRFWPHVNIARFGSVASTQLCSKYLWRERLKGRLNEKELRMPLFRILEQRREEAAYVFVGA
jgi:hypothetical protein